MSFNETGNASYPQFVGFIASGVAVAFFGSNYVPVKKVEPHDGIAFQFFMSAGIWLVGLSVHLVRQCPRLHPLAMLGGIMWSTGNLCVVPIIQTIGLSLGLLLWGSVNMLSGWASGRFGWFDVPAKEPSNSALNFAGVGVSLLASFLIFFVTPTVEMVDEAIATVAENSNRPDQASRWRQFSDQCDSVSIYEENINTVNYASRNSAGPYDDDDEPLLLSDDNRRGQPSTSTKTMAASDTAAVIFSPAPLPWLRLSPGRQRVLGILLCILIGPLFGLGFVPALYVQSHVEGASQSGLDFVFAHFTGILSASTVYFFVYCLASRNRPAVSPGSALPAAASGVMWGVACSSWYLANEILSTAVTFPIVTTVPAVLAAAWGVCVFREIRGTRNLILLAGVLVVTAAGSTLTGLSIG